MRHDQRPAAARAVGSVQVVHRAEGPMRPHAAPAFPSTMSCVHRQRLIEGSEEPCGHTARIFCLTARAKAVGRIHVSCYASCRMPILNAQPREEAQPTTRPSSWLLVPTLAPSRCSLLLLAPALTPAGSITRLHPVSLRNFPLPFHERHFHAMPRTLLEGSSSP